MQSKEMIDFVHNIVESDHVLSPAEVGKGSRHFTGSNSLCYGNWLLARETKMNEPPESQCSKAFKQWSVQWDGNKKAGTSERAEVSSRWRYFWRRIFSSFSCFASVLFTYALVYHLNHCLVSNAADTKESIWCLHTGLGGALRSR